MAFFPFAGTPLTAGLGERGNETELGDEEALTLPPTGVAKEELEEEAAALGRTACLTVVACACVIAAARCCAASFSFASLPTFSSFSLAFSRSSHFSFSIRSRSALSSRSLASRSSLALRSFLSFSSFSFPLRSHSISRSRSSCCRTSPHQQHAWQLRVSLAPPRAFSGFLPLEQLLWLCRSLLGGFLSSLCRLLFLFGQLLFPNEREKRS